MPPSSLPVNGSPAPTVWPLPANAVRAPEAARLENAITAFIVSHSRQDWTVATISLISSGPGRGCTKSICTSFWKPGTG